MKYILNKKICTKMSLLAPVLIILCILCAGCVQNPYAGYEIISSSESESSKITETPGKYTEAVPSNTPYGHEASPTPSISAVTKSPSPTASESRETAHTETPETPPAASPCETVPPLPSHEPLNDSFFNGAVFIGDSVTLKLQYYTNNQRRRGSTVLGSAQFLSAGSMGSGNALEPVSEGSIHPTYKGVKMSLQDAVAEMKADKAYIMLGMNDIAVYGFEGSLKNMDKLIGKIHEKSPGVSIYIESVTPMLKGKEMHVLNNTNIAKYNRMLYDFCMQRGYKFMDISSCLRDEGGYLKAGYCSDQEGMGIHLTDEACKIWINYLYNYS